MFQLDTMINYKDYITIEAKKRSCKPCVRGLRITVYDILNMVAEGMTYDEIIDDPKNGSWVTKVCTTP